MKMFYWGRKSMVLNKLYLERGFFSGFGEEWDMVIFFKGVRDKIEMRLM